MMFFILKFHDLDLYPWYVSKTFRDIESISSMLCFAAEVFAETMIEHILPLISPICQPDDKSQS